MHARTSLAAVGQYLQYQEMLTPSATYGVGCASLGYDEMHRNMRVADGYLYVAPQRLRWDAVCAAWPCIKTAISSMACAEAQALLAKYGIDSEPLISLAALRCRHTVERPDIDGPSFQFVQKAHAAGVVTMVAPIAIRWDRICCTICDAPKHGTHTREVLMQVGMLSLVLTAEASERWSRQYLPCMIECNRCHKPSAIVTLCCGHSYCHECCAFLAHCCGVSCDLQRIRSCVLAFQRGYNAWRRGEARGTCELLQLLRGSTGHLSRSQSCPSFNCQLPAVASHDSFASL